jgi:uncharacterized integral membrane protein
MGRVIVTVILVVVLVVLVSMNIGFTTTVNLFGTKFDNVSVVAVAALSFALGVVYSLIIHISKSLRRRAKRGLVDRDRQLTEREKELSNRLSDVDRLSDASKPVDAYKDELQSDVRKKAEDEKIGRPESGGRSGLAKLFFGSRAYHE